MLTWGVDSPAWIRSADGRKLASLGPAEGALQLSDGRLLTWSATGAKLWPPDDAALVAYADRVVAALEPLTAAERCAFFLVASRDGC